MANGALMRLNAERCESELERVDEAISRLLNRPAKVDFYSVATESGVSRSTLYRNPKLRALVESARDSQPDPWELVAQLTAENACLRKRLETSCGFVSRRLFIVFESGTLSRAA